MAAIHGASFSSSSSSTSRRAYDVFLSFRGEDTRKNFTGHLYTALRRNGINTFMDNNLRTGEEISLTLLKTIEESKISIIVLSKNYSSSQWCLDELMKILECRKTMGQNVLPLFYGVDPSEVRNQTNSIGEAFVKLEKRFKDNKMKVNGWKTALRDVANLSGMPLGNRNEPDFIHEVIEKVNSILVKKTYFQVAQYPVGIESRVQDVKLLLDMEKNDSTCMVGIFGIGGIGKTTIAKAIYNLIASQFEGSCFLENIRETSSQKGLIHLQNKLLSKILGGSSLMVDNVDQGISLIEQRLHNLRVLLVLDDVDHLVQLEKLAGKGDWFGLGSRIIVTTRDKHLLVAHGVDSTYQVNELNHNEALQLFSWHAFKSDESSENFMELTEDAICYSGGLPLALTVLGSALKGRDILYWKIKLDEYKRIPHGDIQKKLRISFDGLDENAKNIFLDIACFFKEENVEYVTKILDCCGYYSYSGIEELKDKCLITQSYRSLEMHDLLQEMGREIVRQESPKEPGQRSRLWFHEDVRHVLEGNTGTNKVEGILIDLPKQDLIRLSPEAFEKMKMLRMLINRGAHFFEEPNFLSNELRLLDWPEYYGESLPSNFCGQNLSVLRMPYSHLKELEAVQHFQNLTFMDFSYCKFLKTIPDVSRIPNLEKLYLIGCKNLLEVHHSVGFLNKLIDLCLIDCSNLRSFPRRLKLRSLEYLLLYGCSKLKNFPKIECQMECLKLMDFKYTRIEDLPSPIGYLVGVKKLYLDGCTNLKNLPDNIQVLQHLEYLSLNGCTGIKELPSSTVYLVRIKGLYLEGCTNLMNLPNGIYRLQHLQDLTLNNCKQLREILELPPHVKYVNAMGCVSLDIFLEEHRRSSLSLGKNVLTESVTSIPRYCPFNSLEYLNLSSTAIVSLPTWFKRFVGLKQLHLEDCKQLREIPELPPNIKFVQLP
ncbi:disease resistance protein RPV1-like [Corylus avellana]|uniref:disease resistance protein RPV1-like n=1 Tax=Corylus avellana TaxID=13451 RepID=UPI00286ACD5A|nr:disease resistance protein RPV1-like [Corylus avellana]